MKNWIPFWNVQKWNWKFESLDWKLESLDCKSKSLEWVCGGMRDSWDSFEPHFETFKNEIEHLKVSIPDDNSTEENPNKVMKKRPGLD